MKVTHEISNSDDVIDSRDVIARIEELEGFRDDAETDAESNLAAGYGKETSPKGIEYQTSLDFGEDDYNELATLLELAEEGSGSPDWKYGETLIHDSYFENYAQELAEDIGAISKDQSWPNNHIDWEAAADALKQDYFTVNFGGEQYWIRA